LALSEDDCRSRVQRLTERFNRSEPEPRPRFEKANYSFVIAPRWLWDRKAFPWMTDKDREVWLALRQAIRSGGGNYHGVAVQMTEKQISKISGCGEKTVRQSLKKLKAHHLITVTRRPYENLPNIYVLFDPKA
jgi:hypothetical protein